MSTRLTSSGVPMVDSQTLNLVVGAGQVSELISRKLSNDLKKKGYKFASPSALNFLSALECGINYGSDIARNLGVSRQMVAKTVKELCTAGYLKQVEGVGKQKKILFTVTGELLMSDARSLLADMDNVLIQKVGNTSLLSIVDNLKIIQELIKSIEDNN